jgi:Na+/H+ antiporter NhaC
VDSFGLLGMAPFILAMFFMLYRRDLVFPILGAGDLIFEALSDTSNLLILAITGGTLVLFALLNRWGYVATFTNRIAGRNLDRRLVESVVFGSSLLLFVDRFLATLLAGVFTNPVVEKKKLEPHKHAFILNTTTSSLSALVPFTTVTPIALAVVGLSFQNAGIEFSPTRAFLNSLPYQFYTTFSLFMVLSMTVFQKDLFPMRIPGDEKVLSFGLQTSSRQRASYKLSLWAIVSTLGVLFGVIAAGMIIHSLSPSQAGDGRTYRLVFINALFVSIIFAVLLSLIAKQATYGDLREKGIVASRPLMTVFLYLVLALAVAGMAKKLDFQMTLLGLLRNTDVRFMPLMIFVISSLFSFLCGSMTLTITAIMPGAIRIMGAGMTDPLLVNELLFATIGAVMAGSVFGDLNSPFSPNFILATAVSKSSVFGHFKTQVYHSLVVFSISLLFGYLLMGLGITPYLSHSMGFLVIAVVVYVLGNRFSVSAKGESRGRVKRT